MWGARLFLILSLTFFIFNDVFAEENEDYKSIGKFAEALMEPVGIVGDFIGSGSLILGVACIFASLLRYMQHRVNHLASPMSTVIMLLVLGIVLLCLPFLHLLMDWGVPFPHK